MKTADGTATTTKEHIPSAAEQHVLWFYFTSLVKEAKWSDCMERFAEAKANTERAGWTHLDNAIMAVSLTYRQYEYGWSVYEQMKEMDRNSAAIVMSLCYKAFFARNPETKEPVHSKSEVFSNYY